MGNNSRLWINAYRYQLEWQNNLLDCLGHRAFEVAGGGGGGNLFVFQILCHTNFISKFLHCHICIVSSELCVNKVVQMYFASRTEML